MREFDLDKLKTSIKEIDVPELQLLFAASIAERVFPLVVEFAVSHNICDSVDLSKCLDIIWFQCKEENEKQIISRLENCLEKILDMSKEPESEQGVVAFYGAEVLINSLDAKHKKIYNPEQLSYIGTAGYNIADYLALVKNDPVGEGVGVDSEMLLSDKLVQSELELQEKAIGFIQEMIVYNDYSPHIEKMRKFFQSKTYKPDLVVPSTYPNL